MLRKLALIQFPLQRAMACLTAATMLMGNDDGVLSCVGLRNWVAAKTSMDQLAQPGASNTPKEEDLPKGEPVTLFRSLRDGPRIVDQLLLAPR